MKSFDDIIKYKLEEEQFKPTEQGWQAIQQRLQANTPTQASNANHNLTIVTNNATGKTVSTSWLKSINSKKIAAVLLPLIAIGTLAILLNKKTIKNDAEIVSTNKNEVNNTINQNKETTTK
jgi:hypothetical protein